MWEPSIELEKLDDEHYRLTFCDYDRAFALVLSKEQLSHIVGEFLRVSWEHYPNKSKITFGK
jgi:hypothetical protein